MITKRSVRDVANHGDEVILEGEIVDRLPNDNTVTIDPENGTVYPPGVELGKLPNKELIQLPRTTYYATRGDQ